MAKRAAIVPVLVLGLACQRALDSSGADPCSGCQLVVEHVAALGGSHEAFSLEGGGAITADSRGRLITLTFDRRQLAVFDPSGRALGLLGAQGDGPGEFPGPIVDVQFGPGDSLFVLTGRRMTVLDQNLEFARTFSLPAGGSLLTRLVLPDSGVVLNVALPELGGPLHLVSSVGEVVRSFRPSLQGDILIRNMVVSVAHASTPGIWFSKGVNGSERRMTP